MAAKQNNNIKRKHKKS